MANAILDAESNEHSFSTHLGQSKPLLESTTTEAIDRESAPSPSESSRYARKYLLDRHAPRRKKSIWGKVRDFYESANKQTGLLHLQFILALICVVVNLGFSVWALIAHPPVHGVGTIFTGDCAYVSKLNSGAHVILNGVSTAFLGAGNYCMQILTAPKAEDVQAAHDRGKRLEIGVHSPRNVFRLGIKRYLPWIVLGGVSIVLHLAWNSAIFASLPFVLYPQVAVTSDYETARSDWARYHPGLSFSKNFTIPGLPGNPSGFDLIHRVEDFTELDTQSCIAAFIDPLNATQELILVINSTSSCFEGSSLVMASIIGANTGSWSSSHYWICFDSGLMGHPGQFHYCNAEMAQAFHYDWKVHFDYRNMTETRIDAKCRSGTYPLNFTFEHITGVRRVVAIERCLVGEAGNQQSRCGFHYSFGLLMLVCTCTVVELLAIGWVLLLHHVPVILVLGDAISASLRGKISTPLVKMVRGPCIGRRQRLVTLGQSAWIAKPRFWYTAVSMSSWLMAVSLYDRSIMAHRLSFANRNDRFFIADAIATTELVSALRSLSTSGISTSLSSLWSQGLGKMNSFSLTNFSFLSEGTYEGQVYRNVLFANSFQLLVSLYYLTYNNILSRQLVADELTGYLNKRRPLRVSRPEKSQRSSYFLSLPWSYGIPVMVSFALLHWLVSQAIFLVQISAWGPGPQGQRIPSNDHSQCGFSAIGIILSLALSILLVLALFANSFRKYPPVPKALPAMAYNSSAIAAMCQRPTDDHDAQLYPVRLGIVKDGVELTDSTVGRLSFTSDMLVSQPVLGEVYEQPRWL